MVWVFSEAIKVNDIIHVEKQRKKSYIYFKQIAWEHFSYILFCIIVNQNTWSSILRESRKASCRSFVSAMKGVFVCIFVCFCVHMQLKFPALAYCHLNIWPSTTVLIFCPWVFVIFSSIWWISWENEVIILRWRKGSVSWQWHWQKICLIILTV